MVNQIMKIKPPAVKNMQINSVFGHRAIMQMYTMWQMVREVRMNSPQCRNKKNAAFIEAIMVLISPPDVQMDYVESEFPLRVPLLV